MSPTQITRVEDVAMMFFSSALVSPGLWGTLVLLTNYLNVGGTSMGRMMTLYASDAILANFRDKLCDVRLSYIPVPRRGAVAKLGHLLSIVKSLGPRFQNENNLFRNGALNVANDVIERRTVTSQNVVGKPGFELFVKLAVLQHKMCTPP
jgi:uncharacterized membrane protein (UPF0136 family)